MITLSNNQTKQQDHFDMRTTYKEGTLPIKYPSKIRNEHRPPPSINAEDENKNILERQIYKHNEACALLSDEDYTSYRPMPQSHWLKGKTSQLFGIYSENFGEQTSKMQAPFFFSSTIDILIHKVILYLPTDASQPSQFF